MEPSSRTKSPQQPSPSLISSSSSPTGRIASRTIDDRRPTDQTGIENRSCHRLPPSPVSNPTSAQIQASTIPQPERIELPLRFEDCEIDDLIELIAGMLNRLINHNDQIPLTSTSLTRFHSRSPPTISIKDYLKRIYRYTNPERICLILILNYIDRICKNLTNFTICSLTVHRFCITSVTVGSKFICDSFYSNARYAKVGGISLTEINLLEREFLLAIDYRLLASNEELNKYYLSLVESHPLYTIQKPSRTLSGIASIVIKGIDPSSKSVELGGSEEKEQEARVTECRRSCDDPQPKQASSGIESDQRDPKRIRSKDQSAPLIQDRTSSTRAVASPIDRDPPIDSPRTQQAPQSHVSPDCFVEDENC